MWVAVDPISVLKASADYPFDREVREMAEALVESLRERIGLLKDIDWKVLEEAIERKNVAAAVRAIPWRKFDEATREMFERAILEGISTVGRRAAEIDGLAAMGFSFQPMDEHAINWAKSHAAELVREISKETRRALSRVVTLNLRAGVHPYRIMEDIGSMVGLIERHVQAVHNFRAALEKRGLSKDVVAKRVAKKIERLHKWRMENIARTESLTAAAKARNMVWEQAADMGFLDEQQVKREWLVAADERLCSKCASMNGQQAPLRGSYPNGLERPPAHPSCRCAENLVFAPGYRPTKPRVSRPPK